MTVFYRDHESEWHAVSIIPNWSPCLRFHNFIKLPCTTTESWWMDPFHMPFQIAEQDGNPNPEGYCTYTTTESAFISHNCQISAFTSPCSCHWMCFMNLPVQITYLCQMPASTVGSVRRKIWGKRSKDRSSRYLEAVKIILLLILEKS